MREGTARVRVAAVQMAPVLMDRDATIEKVLAILQRCGREGVRLAVFPETIVPGYPYFALVEPPILLTEHIARLHTAAVEVPGPATEAVAAAAAAAGTVVVLGINERDGGSLYNTQLIFDADGSLVGHRRKIMPTHQERMVWGLGDGSGLVAYDTAVGRVGALICWEHYMPLARYALIEQREQIHCSHFPGSLLGERMAAQIDAAIRHHAMESGAFVVNATGWLSDEQRAGIAANAAALAGLLQGGLCTAVVSPQGEYLAGPLPDGEGMAVAEIDLATIVETKSVLDTVGHYARPDLLSLRVDRRVRAVVEEVAPWQPQPHVHEGEQGKADTTAPAGTPDNLEALRGARRAPAQKP